jgi:hypothetical protein
VWRNKDHQLEFNSSNSMSNTRAQATQQYHEIQGTSLE